MKIPLQLIAGLLIVGLSQSNRAAPPVEHIQSVNPGSQKDCPNSSGSNTANVCTVFVPVTMNPKNPYHCQVENMTEKVFVHRNNPNGPKVQIFWQIQPAPGPANVGYQFQFVQGNGIGFVPPSTHDGSIYPPDDMDFDTTSSGWDNDPTKPASYNRSRYQLISLNGHGSGQRQFHYAIQIQWQGPNSQQWNSCDPADPKIVNTQ